MLQEAVDSSREKMAAAGVLGNGVSLNFSCSDALAIYRDAATRGIHTLREPQVGNFSWEVVFADPDGYRIHFSSSNRFARGNPALGCPDLTRSLISNGTRMTAPLDPGKARLPGAIRPSSPQRSGDLDRGSWDDHGARAGRSDYSKRARRTWYFSRGSFYAIHIGRCARPMSCTRTGRGQSSICGRSGPDYDSMPICDRR